MSRKSRMWKYSYEIGKRERTLKSYRRYKRALGNFKRFLIKETKGKVSEYEQAE